MRKNKLSNKEENNDGGSPEDWLKSLGKSMGDDLHVGTQDVKCFSSGIYSLDRALGGGFAAGRAHLLVGKESTGKSTLSARLAGQVNRINRETGEYCDPNDSMASRVLYVDQEGTVSPDWSYAHGFEVDGGGNKVVTTNTGNQAVDLINSAIQTKFYSLIILDSIEALMPHKDLEKSSEDFLVGTKAKMNNDACRRWGVALTDSARSVKNWWQRPTLLLVNQLRDAISIMPTPPVIPGGIGQRQLASTIIQMNSPKYKDDGKLGGRGEFRGVVKKSKTSTPRKGFTYEMNLSDAEEGGLGFVDNIQGIVRDIKSHKLWVKEGSEWDLFGFKAPKQDQLIQKMRAEPDFENLIREKVLGAIE